MGRECVLHYSILRRYCVFSHDELVCKMALEADSLSLTVALAAYRDMRTMLHTERKLRKSILHWVSLELDGEHKLPHTQTRFPCVVQTMLTHQLHCISTAGRLQVWKCSVA